MRSIIRVSDYVEQAILRALVVEEDEQIRTAEMEALARFGIGETVLVRVGLARAEVQEYHVLCFPELPPGQYGIGYELALEDDGAAPGGGTTVLPEDALTRLDGP